LLASHIKCCPQYTMKITRSHVRVNSGSLCQFIQVKKSKDGSLVEYPKVTGERNIFNINHYNWCYTFKEKLEDKFITRTKSVPRAKVLKLQGLIAKGTSVVKILNFLK
jgi:hypothetical protein